MKIKVGPRPVKRWGRSKLISADLQCTWSICTPVVTTRFWRHGGLLLVIRIIKSAWFGRIPSYDLGGLDWHAIMAWAGARAANGMVPCRNYTEPNPNIFLDNNFGYVYHSDLEPKLLVLDPISIRGHESSFRTGSN